MKRLVPLVCLVLASCLLPEFPGFEERFLHPDAGSGGGAGTGGGGGGGGFSPFDAGPVPLCRETTPLTAEQLLRTAVRAASCGVTEGTATPNEWPRLMLDWSRVLQREKDYEGRPGVFVDVPSDACARLKCLARATSCDDVFACYGGVTVDAGACASGDRCDFGRAVHCDASRGPAWSEGCSQQGQPCTVDTSGHAVCGTTCAATSQGQCLAQNAALARCNLGAGRTYTCEGRCYADATTASCVPASGGQCSGNHCNGDVAVECPTRVFGDSLDCSALPGGGCAQVPGFGPVFCAPKGGASCAGSLAFFTSCDANTLVVCANNSETRIDCAALGFSSCVNGGPAGVCH